MLKWIGKAKGMQGLIGIPARDLTQVEVVQFGGEKALIATGLYAKSKGGKVKSGTVPTVSSPGPEIIKSSGKPKPKAEKETPTNDA